jgi:hypothetical protein
MYIQLLPCAAIAIIIVVIVVTATQCIPCGLVDHYTHTWGTAILLTSAS